MFRDVKYVIEVRNEHEEDLFLYQLYDKEYWSKQIAADVDYGITLIAKLLQFYAAKLTARDIIPRGESFSRDAEQKKHYDSCLTEGGRRSSTLSAKYRFFDTTEEISLQHNILILLNLLFEKVEKHSAVTRLINELFDRNLFNDGSLTSLIKLTTIDDFKKILSIIDFAIGNIGVTLIREPYLINGTSLSNLTPVLRDNSDIINLLSLVIQNSYLYAHFATTVTEDLFEKTNLLMLDMYIPLDKALAKKACFILPVDIFEHIVKLEELRTTPYSAASATPYAGYHPHYESTVEGLGSSGGAGGSGASDAVYTSYYPSLFRK